MILETVRVIRDALESETYGVNVKLAAMTTDDGDPVPADIKRVLDPTRDDEGAKQKPARDWPVLLLGVDEPATAAGEVGTVYRDADQIVVTIGYWTRKADDAKAVTDTLYTMRAIVQCLRTLMENAQAADRERNSVQVRVCTFIRFGLVMTELAEGAITGAVQAGFQVRDVAP